MARMPYESGIQATHLQTTQLNMASVLVFLQAKCFHMSQSSKLSIVEAAFLKPTEAKRLVYPFLLLVVGCIQLDCSQKPLTSPAYSCED